MRIHKITYPDIENGLGFRITIWVSGCNHKCKGCQNPETWDEMSGREFTNEDKENIFEILKEDYIKGVTFSGGDPLCYYAAEVAELCKELKDKFPKKDIWLYTGYTKQEILRKDERRDVIKHIDVLVDGEFHLHEKDTSLEFRGSRNQMVYEVTYFEDDSGFRFKPLYVKK